MSGISIQTIFLKKLSDHKNQKKYKIEKRWKKKLEKI